MKKVIKIKESKVLDILNKVINEQSVASQSVVVGASNTLGTSPNFDGLKTLVKNLKNNIEKTLRGSKPYRIVPNANGNIASAKKEGGALRLDVTLTPCKEQERDWYFDCSLAIYSEVNTNSVDILRAKVTDKAATRGLSFVGSEKKVRVLGENTITLTSFKNLDPNNPDKIFKLFIVYIGALRPQGHQDVLDDSDETSGESLVSKDNEPQPSGENPWNQSNSTVAAGSTTQTKEELNEVVKGTYTASNCDELHAFQGTSGKVIGNMNVTVGEKLEELYNMGHNPRVMEVKVIVDDMTVSWECLIKDSPDGKAWVGFTSRGAGCNNDVKNRAESAAVGNDIASAKKRIMSVYKEDAIDIQKADEVNYNGGENSFRQVFYVYTKPKSFPPHK